ncbi:TolC family protein [Shewanella algae]|uniref:TolC family protein n=1 Tax=Shewanella algae TaxID=38313 RepID=UPI0021B2490D|nr:TolC family protein [Shewanella algae]
MKKHILAAIVAVTLVSGCSMAPDYQLPSVKVSELYFNADTQGVAAQALDYQEWWRQFNDPQLDALVAKAQQQNINLKIAAERIRSAQAYETAVSSLKLPSVSLGGGYMDLRISENDPMMGAPFPASPCPMPSVAAASN